MSELELSARFGSNGGFYKWIHISLNGRSFAFHIEPEHAAEVLGIINAGTELVALMNAVLNNPTLGHPGLISLGVPMDLAHAARVKCKTEVTV